MKSKIESYMGFAAKSGNVFSGNVACTKAMQKGKVKLLIIAEDTAEGTSEKLLSDARKYNVPVEIYGDSFELSRMIGKPGRNVFAIIDKNFANIISKEIGIEKKEVF